MFQIIDTSPASLKKLNDYINRLEQMIYDQNGASLRSHSITSDKLATGLTADFVDISVSDTATINDIKLENALYSYAEELVVG